MSGVDQRFRSAAIRLLDRGVDTTYIYSILHHRNTRFLENMVKINVSGFIKRADYSHNFNAQSVRTTREFYTKNYDLLKRVEDSTGVAASVLTSILWVETKFGTVCGEHNVVSVYASLAAADESQNVDVNKQTYRNSGLSTDSVLKLDSIVEARAKRKAAWSIDQLIALKDMQGRITISINELRGSWAGAFGWPQFIPSSYLSWSVDGNGDGKTDLFDKEDAIASVGNYLKVNGWGADRTQQEAAVYHYNNSKDYVNCILTLAEKIAEAQP
jgi:membrane-bound lytic murein transglycosylase B